MPIKIPSTVLTTSYQNFGGAQLCSTGYLFIANGPVDVVLTYGSDAGLTETVDFLGISAGQYYFQGGTAYGIVGIQIRGAGGTVTVPAQTVQGNFTEPALPSLIPVAGGVTIPTVPPALTQLADATVAPAGGTPSVTFASIPQTANHLRVIYYAASLAAGTNDAVLITINSDVGNNYYNEQLIGDTAAASAIMTGPVGPIGIAVTPAAGSPGGDVWTSGELLIPSYQFALTHSFVSTFYAPYNLGTNQRSSIIGGTHQVDAAVSRLDFTLSSGGNFRQFSRFTLYGLT